MHARARTHTHTHTQSNRSHSFKVYHLFEVFYKFSLSLYTKSIFTKCIIHTRKRLKLTEVSEYADYPFFENKNWDMGTTKCQKHEQVLQGTYIYIFKRNRISNLTTQKRARARVCVCVRERERESERAMYSGCLLYTSRCV